MKNVLTIAVVICILQGVTPRNLWEMPKIIIPEIKFPDLKLPNMTIPGIKLPNMTIPNIPWPNMTIPEIKLPNITIPGLNTTLLAELQFLI